MYVPDMSGKTGWLYGVVDGCGYYYKPYLKGKKVKFEMVVDNNFSTPFKFVPLLTEEPPTFYVEKEDAYEPNWDCCKGSLFWKEKKGEAFFIGVKWVLTDDGTLLYESFCVQDTSYKGDATYDGEIVARYESLL